VDHPAAAMRSFGRIYPFQRHFHAMRAAGGHPGNGGTGERGAGIFRPVLEVLFGHLRIISNQPGQVHGVIDARVVEIESEAIIHLDALLDLLEFLDFHAEAGFGNAVIEENVSVAFAAERFDFSEDFLGSHGFAFCPSNATTEKGRQMEKPDPPTSRCVLTLPPRAGNGPLSPALSPSEGEREMVAVSRCTPEQFPPKVWLASAPIERLSIMICHKSSVSSRWSCLGVSLDKP